MPRIAPSIEQKKSAKALLNNRDVWLIAAGLIITTYLHYSTNHTLQTIHTVYRSLYYLPILYAALRFGLRGGLIVALLSGAAYIPYVFIVPFSRQPDVVEDLLEVLLYIVVSGLTGWLVDTGRRQRRQQRELAAQVRRAERLSSLGTLAGGLAHEIRNPLGSIRASAQMLAEETTDPDAREYLTVIQDEADRINRLIESLLDFARPTHVEIGPVELNKLLHDVANLTQSYAARSGVMVTLALPDEPSTVRGERDRLHQCVLNLTLNASQAMPAGGRLTLSLAQIDHYACLEVIDAGHGISPIDLPHIFDPFFSSKDSGTGLGLAIVQRIVTDHKGRVEVESELNRGTVFRVWLPLIAYISREGNDT